LDGFYLLNKIVSNIRISARYNQLTKSRLSQMSLKYTVNQYVLPTSTLYKKVKKV